MVTCYWKIHESFLDTNSDTPSEATQHEKNESAEISNNAIVLSQTGNS